MHVLLLCYLITVSMDKHFDQRNIWKVSEWEIFHIQSPHQCWNQKTEAQRRAENLERELEIENLLNKSRNLEISYLTRHYFATSTIDFMSLFFWCTPPTSLTYNYLCIRSSSPRPGWKLHFWTIADIYLKINDEVEGDTE